MAFSDANKMKTDLNIGVLLAKVRSAHKNIELKMIRNSQSVPCNFYNLCSIAVRLESNRQERYFG